VGKSAAFSDVQTRDLLSELKADEKAYQYLVRLHNRISKDRRGLFVLSTGLVGTGPPEVEIGDVVYLLVGIPMPMTLRRKPTDEVMRVVGAALVHGLMHGEYFIREETSDVVLI
jgi:hypothetical protein